MGALALMIFRKFLKVMMIIIFTVNSQKQPVLKNFSKIVSVLLSSNFSGALTIS